MVGKVFEGAKILPSRNPPRAKKEMQFWEIAGVEEIAEMDALIDILKKARDDKVTEMGAFALAHFKNHMSKKGERPESFIGIEGEGSVLFTMKRRSSSSILSDEDIQHLQKFNIPVKYEILTPALAAINPAYAEDIKLMRRVKELLNVNGMPKDLIVLQQEVKKPIVDDAALDAILKKPTIKLLSIATTIQLKSKLEKLKPVALSNLVKKLVKEALGPKENT